MAKLLVVSFEGMNYKLLMDWIDGGYLPSFQRVMEAGYLSDINCSRVPYEASGLVSAFSGLEDSEHGVLSYWRVHNRNYQPQVWTSNDIKDISILQNKDLNDYKLGIVNIFGTHPVQEINGYTISYAMDRTLRYTYPPNLIYDLVSENLPYVQDMGAFFKNQGKAPFLSEVRRVEQMRHKVSKGLLQKDLDVYIVNYTCIDRLCHFYMSEIKDETISLEEKAVFKVYQDADKILADILKYIDKTNADLLIFSSVGFGPLKHFIEINPYLAKKGLLQYGENNRQPHWKKTVAFESVQGTHGININRASVYADGMVQDSEYESLIQEVIHQLEKMENPYNGNPMFSKIVKGRDYYRNHTSAPDIMLEPFDWEYIPYGDSYWADNVHRHCQTGWHRNQSVWGGIGPNISGKVKGGKADLANIAPTIQSILGQPLKSKSKYESLVK